MDLEGFTSIINGSELHSSNFVSTFLEKLIFSQLYDFIKSHKQFVYNKNIPHTSCLCDTSENIVLLAKGLNNYKRLTASARLPETPHDIVEKYSCSSDDKDCMFDDCTECSSGKLCQLPDSNPDSESDLDSNSDSDTSCLVSFYRWETPDKHVTKIRISEPFEEATERFKESVVSLKRHIYSKRSQNRHYNHVKESLDHGQILVHVDYAESYKNSQQNEIQSAYFGNSTFSIFTACCYTKSLDNGGLKKDSIVVVNDSKEHNRAAALTCLKKVVEKAEEINVAKYDKIIVWSSRCSSQFCSRFVFYLLTEDLLDGVELTWNCNQKIHGKGPMDGVEGTVKNIIFRKVKSGFVTIDSPFEFHQVILKFVPSIKSVHLSDTDVMNEPENIEQESKNIPETLNVYQAERLEVKGVYGLKIFYQTEDEQPFYTQWYSNGKDVVICGYEITDADDNHCVLCFEEYQQRKEWIQCPGLCQ